MVDQNDEHETTTLTAVVRDDQAGMRLDQAVAQLFGDYSRSRLTAWIKEGRVSVEGGQRRPRDMVWAGVSARHPYIAGLSCLAGILFLTVQPPGLSNPGDRSRCHPFNRDRRWGCRC